jgi:hypothetical protein
MVITACKYCVVNDFLHSRSLPAVVDVHVEVIGVAEFTPACKVIVFVPRAQHDDALVVFVFHWQRCLDAVLVSLEISRST